jgi:hypothetical protein
VPVYKYRSVADMPRVPPATGGDLADRIRAVWRRSQLFCPLRPPRGVMRFRSVEEADRARQQATRERMRRIADGG